MRTAQSPGIGATMGRMRILVVDDERAVREALGRALARDAGGLPRRRRDRVDADRVFAAGALSPQSTSGVDAVGDLRARVGLRLRFRVELARRLHRVSAP